VLNFVVNLSGPYAITVAYGGMYSIPLTKDLQVIYDHFSELNHVYNILVLLIYLLF
jgi:hypothetical protein